MENYQRSMIACSAPIAKTIPKFWQMIWENQTSLVVMLCPEQGPKGEECLNYWNNLTKIGENSLISEDLMLTLIDYEQINARICKRKFSLKNLSCPDQLLEVEHVHDFGWEDDTAIQDEAHFGDVDYIIGQMFIHRDILTKKQCPPIVVHCSAGIGRTGTIVAIFNILEGLKYANQNIEELKLVESDYI